MNNVLTESFVLSSPAKSATYYWKVDTVLKEGPPFFIETIIPAGQVWSFETAPEGVGSVVRERWDGIGGAAVSDLVANSHYQNDPPDTSETLTTRLEGTVNWANSFGSRVRAWLYIINTGDYTFWTSSDDASELWLSTDERPQGAQLIAYETGYSGSKNWQTGNQQSAPIHLEGGKRYYLELLHKEGGGGDNLAVAYQGPDQPTAPVNGQDAAIIPTSRLKNFQEIFATKPQPADGGVLIGTSVTLSWTPGAEEDTATPYVSHDVYVGTDAAAVASATKASPEYKGNSGALNEFGPVGPLSHQQVVYWRVDGINAAGEAIVGGVWSFTAYDPAQLVDPNLVGWWKLDGDATDSSGYGNHGTELGSPRYIPGVIGEAFDPDRNDDFIDCGNAPLLNRLDAMSVMCWVKGPFTRGWECFVTKRGEGDGWKLRRQGGSNNACFTIRDTSGPDDPRGSININDGEWHHVAGTWDGVDRNLYVDGQLDRSDPDTGTMVPTIDENVIIGGWMAGPGDIRESAGIDIDDVRLYDKAVSQEQIMQIFRINLAWAYNPDPAHRATGVGLNPTLSWTPGDYATAHRVSLGEDKENLVELPGQPQAANSVAVSDLNLDTTYYWQVDEANAAAAGGYDTGRLWRFTTQDSLMVDDMESYDFDPQLPADANWIFYVWVDGLGDYDCLGVGGNGSGANVYAQDAIVLGGSKAMRYQYDNDGTAEVPCDGSQGPRAHLYSLARAEVAELPSGIGSDWTVGGAKVLVVPFFGDSLNVVDTMWVVLEDKAGNKAYATYGDNSWEDPEDVNDPSWHNWYISLQTFADGGVDLTDVNAIGIGFGDRTDTTAGGNGNVYFDQIRISAPVCILAARDPAFAKYDYVGDCVVDYKELDQMGSDWLKQYVDETALWAGTWTSADVGATDPAGSFMDNGDGTYTITGDGGDIWGAADGFHYAYQQVSGDAQITVRVTSVEDIHSWVKVGVMIRQSLDANSPHATIIGRPGDRGVSFQRRLVAGAGSQSSSNGAPNLPYCLRILRNGDNFAGYYHNGTNWVQLGPTVNIPMTDPVYIGMCVTSHISGTLATGTLDRACSDDFIPTDLNTDDIVNFLDYADLVATKWLEEDLFGL